MINKIQLKATLITIVIFGLLFSVLTFNAVAQSSTKTIEQDRGEKNYSEVLQVIHDGLKLSPEARGQQSPSASGELQSPVGGVGVFIETDDKESTREWLEARGSREMNVFENLPFIFAEISIAELKLLYDREEVLSFHEDKKYFTKDESNVGDNTRDAPSEGLYDELLAEYSQRESEGGQQAPAGVDTTNEKYTGNNQVIAILDGGFTTEHEYYKDRIIYEACYSTHNPPREYSKCPQERFDESPAYQAFVNGYLQKDYLTPDDEVLDDIVSFSLNRLPSVAPDGTPLTEDDYLLPSDLRVQYSAVNCPNNCQATHGALVAGVAAGKKVASRYRRKAKSRPAQDAELVLVEVSNVIAGPDVYTGTFSSSSIAKSLDKLIQLKKNGVNIVVANFSAGIEVGIDDISITSYERIPYATINKNSIVGYSGSGVVEYFSIFVKEDTNITVTSSNARVVSMRTQENNFDYSTDKEELDLSTGTANLFLKAGVHRVELDPIGDGEKVEYTLTFSTSTTYDIGDDTATSETVGFDNASINDDLSDVDDVDWYQVTLEYPGEIVIRSTGDIALSGDLHDASVFEDGVSGLLYTNSGTSENNFEIIRDMRPGVYYLKVKGKDTNTFPTAQYQIGFDFTPSSLDVYEKNRCEASIGSSSTDIALGKAVSALKSADIALTVASGNGGLNSINRIAPSSPGCFSAFEEYNNVIEVGGVDPLVPTENFYAFDISRYSTDVFASGLDIFSSEIVNFSTRINNKWSYGTFGGTSFSAPHIASVYATLSEKYPKTSVLQLKNRIINSGAHVLRHTFGTTDFVRYYKTLVSKLEALNPISPYVLSLNCNGDFGLVGDGDKVCVSSDYDKVFISGRAEPGSEIMAVVNGEVSEHKVTTNDKGRFNLNIGDVINTDSSNYDIKVVASDALFDYIDSADVFLDDVMSNGVVNPYVGCNIPHKKYSQCVDALGLTSTVTATIEAVATKDVGYVGAFAEEKYGGELETSKFIYEGNEYIVTEVHSRPGDDLVLYFNSIFEKIKGLDSIELTISDVSTGTSTDLIMVYDADTEGYVSTDEFVLAESSYALEISF